LFASVLWGRQRIRGRWGPVTRIVDKVAYDYFYWAAEMDGHGTTTIAWEERKEADASVLAKRWRADGTLVKRRIVAAAPPYRTLAFVTSVEANRRGDTAVAFTRRTRERRGDPVRGGSLFVVHRPAGGPWGAPDRATTAPSDPLATVDLAQTGDVEAVWPHGGFADERAAPIRHSRYSPSAP